MIPFTSFVTRVALQWLTQLLLDLLLERGLWDGRQTVVKVQHYAAVLVIKRHGVNPVLQEHLALDFCRVHWLVPCEMQLVPHDRLDRKHQRAFSCECTCVSVFPVQTKKERQHRPNTTNEVAR